MARVTAWLEEQKLGRGTINYRLRDWCVSRQRYWGPPIPIIYCPSCGTVPVPEADLPVLLPESDDYIPDGSGKSPLARNEAWKRCTCPQCGGAATRETDVSDNFLDSAWYYLRYPSIGHETAFVDPEITKTWLPVDMYIGGKEHSFGHLLYFRYITMALHDLGFLPFEEPVKRFRAHGIITKDGAKMSKSKGNVVNPDAFLSRIGADTFRLYLMFIGPFTLGGDFSDQGVQGARRFVERLYDFVSQGPNELKPAAVVRTLHRSIRKLGADYESLDYNTGIAQLMTLLNEMRAADARHPELLDALVRLVAPLTPFVAEELYAQLGHCGENDSVFKAGWPLYEEALTLDEAVTVVVQVNGKLRGELVVARGTGREELERLARESEKLQKYYTGAIVKVIVVPDKLVNIVVK